jgi:hypothetical protein
MVPLGRMPIPTASVAFAARLHKSAQLAPLSLHAHADVTPSDASLYQRNSRGPNAAPAKVHSTIVPPYQTATNGNESSVQ